MEQTLAAQNFISQLREIRTNLREALARAESFELKLLGPRPSDANGKSTPESIDSVGQILHEIERLSMRLMGATARPHEIFGDFTPECVTDVRPPARYA